MSKAGPSRSRRSSRSIPTCNHPSRDFARTNEAFRLRRIGEENRITYKGPKHEGPTKTREEIEITLAPGEPAFDQLLRLFENLGFRVVATIRKTRTTFHLADPSHRIEVCLTAPRGWEISPRSRSSWPPNRNYRRHKGPWWPLAASSG